MKKKWKYNFLFEQKAISKEIVKARLKRGLQTVCPDLLVSCILKWALSAGMGNPQMAWLVRDLLAHFFMFPEIFFILLDSFCPEIQSFESNSILFHQGTTFVYLLKATHAISGFRGKIGKTTDISFTTFQKFWNFIIKTDSQLKVLICFDWKIHWLPRYRICVGLKLPNKIGNILFRIFWWSTFGPNRSKKHLVRKIFGIQTQLSPILTPDLFSIE